MPEATPIPTTIDVELRGDEVIEVGDVRFRALAAPGHTPGSVCYLMERKGLRVLFSGDVIMSLTGDQKEMSDMLARPLGFTCPLRNYAALYFIGMYFNLFLPSSVGGDVENAARRAALAKNTRSGFKTDKQLRIGEKLGDRLNFGKNQRRPLVGDAQDQGTRNAAGGFFLAEPEDRGAGRVGNGVGIAEVVFTIQQRVQIPELINLHQVRVIIRDEEVRVVLHKQIGDVVQMHEPIERRRAEALLLAKLVAKQAGGLV